VGCNVVKACIVTYDEYLNIPYIKDYEKLLSKNNVLYDIVFWNRTGDENNLPRIHGNVYTFQHYVKQSKLSKVLPFFQWRMFTKRILQLKSYDCIIVCTTVPAVLLFDILTKKYKERYVLDIRDFTYESVGLYRCIVKRLIAHSGLTTISSKGFLEWLPFSEERYVIMHNLMNDPVVESVY